MNSSAQAVAVALPNPAQPNLASSQVLQDLRVNPDANRKTFGEFVNECLPAFEQDRAEVWKEIESGIELVGHFIAGNQQLMRGPKTGRWRIVKRMNDTRDSVNALPKLGFYVGNLISKNVNGRADCDVLPGDDREESKAAARKGQVLLDWLETQVYKERFCQQEILAGITSGLKARYYRWSTDGDYGFAERPTYEDVPVTMPGGWYCPSCEAGGEVAPEQQPGVCPQCGAPTVQTEGAQQTVTKQTGTQKVKRGMVACESVFLGQLRFDLSVPLEQSHWLRYEQNLPKDRIRAALPDINLDKAVEDGTQGTGEMHERLATSTPFWVGQGANQSKTNASLVTWWLDPCVYSHLVLKERLETLSGQVFEAGTKFGEVWPDGMCLVTLKGVKLPIAVFNEHHKNHWVSAPYHIKLMSGLGTGIGEAVEAQRQWNLLMGLVFTQIRTAATPGLIYDKDIISPDDADLLGAPGMNVPAQTGNLADGKGLKDAIYPLTGQAIPSHLPWYIQQTDYLMQSSTQSVDFSGALPGVKNDTFGGAQIGAQLAQSLQDPVLALQADMDERGGQIMLKLWQQNAWDACFVPKVGERDSFEGEWLSALDIRGDVQVKAKPGSWRARSDFEKREAFEQALNALAAFGGLAMAPPKIVRQIAELYGVNFEVDTYSAQARLCRIRINQIKDLLPVFEEAAQAMAQIMPAAPDTLAMLAMQLVGQIKPPIEPEEPGHPESVDYLREWFLDDEGIEGSPLFRACVKMLIQAHLMAYAQEQAVIAQAQAVTAETQVAEAQADQDGERQKEVERTPNQKKLDGAKKNSGQKKPAANQPKQQRQPAAASAV